MKILIEGWRGIHQSLALVNQYQLLELARMDGIALRHVDLPFSVSRWDRPENLAGFPPELRSAIDDIRAPEEGEDFDAVYRIAIPFQRPNVSVKRRCLTFMVSEFALRRFQFAERERAVESLCVGDDLIVTPSQWSKMKLRDFGFPDDRIRVVPHGVRSDVFFPLNAAERSEIRGELEITPSEFVFLNLGSLTREKGLDVLVTAFSEVRRRHSEARLMLKDTRGLYGHTLEDFFPYHMERVGRLEVDVLESIYLAPSSMPLSDMRRLYGAADCYVSPYRAEGFNLPVIEAIACGTPVIVTGGGATDDFCDPSVALTIDARKVENVERLDYFDNAVLPGYHLEPSVDSLVEQMERALTESAARQSAFHEGRNRIVERFSWRSVTGQLVSLF